MDFDLSPDQETLRDAAAGLLDGCAAPDQVREVVDAGTGHDARLWAAIVGQGWASIEVSESLGGLGLGTVEAAVVAEQVGRHAAPAPVVPTLVATAALADAVSAGAVEAQALLATLLEGGRGAAWSDEGTLAAAPVGGSTILGGRSGPIPGLPIADVAVVVASEPDGGRGLYGVALDDTTRPRAEPAMDRTGTTGWFEPDAVPAVRLGAADAVERLIDRGATLTSAELLGGASRALEMAVEHAKQRHQFGRPIGSFQAVKHRCADMLVDVEGMRSAAYYAAWCLAAGDAERSLAASVAKTWCADAATRVLAGALQVHGGIGFTWDHDLHFFLKRAQAGALAHGDAAAHRRRLISLLAPNRSSSFA